METPTGSMLDETPMDVQQPETEPIAPSFDTHSESRIEATSDGELDHSQRIDSIDRSQSNHENGKTRDHQTQAQSRPDDSNESAQRRRRLRADLSARRARMLHRKTNDIQPTNETVESQSDAFLQAESAIHKTNAIESEADDCPMSDLDDDQMRKAAGMLEFQKLFQHLQQIQSTTGILSTNPNAISTNNGAKDGETMSDAQPAPPNEEMNAEQQFANELAVQQQQILLLQMILQQAQSGVGGMLQDSNDPHSMDRQTPEQMDCRDESENESLKFAKDTNASLNSSINSTTVEEIKSNRSNQSKLNGSSFGFGQLSIPMSNSDALTDTANRSTISSNSTPSNQSTIGYTPSKSKNDVSKKSAIEAATTTTESSSNTGSGKYSSRISQLLNTTASGDELNRTDSGMLYLMPKSDPKAENESSSVNPLLQLQFTAEKALQQTMKGASFLINGDADEDGDGKNDENGPNRHRCRYCEKIFGSDSALQIHIRSHTGERPFKCNVCGNRFTTKGNLKVHFQRHATKWPHVKMNTQPVPEHLDKFHPPLEPPGSSQSPPPMGMMPNTPLNLLPNTQCGSTVNTAPGSMSAETLLTGDASAANLAAAGFLNNALGLPALSGFGLSPVAQMRMLAELQNAQIAGMQQINELSMLNKPENSENTQDKANKKSESKSLTERSRSLAKTSAPDPMERIFGQLTSSTNTSNMISDSEPTNDALFEYMRSLRDQSVGSANAIATANLLHILKQTAQKSTEAEEPESLASEPIVGCPSTLSTSVTDLLNNAITTSTPNPISVTTTSSSSTAITTQSSSSPSVTTSTGTPGQIVSVPTSAANNPLELLSQLPPALAAAAGLLPFLPGGNNLLQQQLPFLAGFLPSLDIQSADALSTCPASSSMSGPIGACSSGASSPNIASNVARQTSPSSSCGAVPAERSVNVLTTPATLAGSASSQTSPNPNAGSLMDASGSQTAAAYQDLLPKPGSTDNSWESLMEVEKANETEKLAQLVEHLDQKPTEPNQCIVCHRVLSCKSALQMHYRTHTGERPFKCKICSRAFTTKGNLKTHMSVHRVKPPLRVMHECQICQQQFTNALVLQQHVKLHNQMEAGSIRTTGAGSTMTESMANTAFSNLNASFLAAADAAAAMSAFAGKTLANFGGEHKNFGSLMSNTLAMSGNGSISESGSDEDEPTEADVKSLKDSDSSVRPFGHLASVTAGEQFQRELERLQQESNQNEKSTGSLIAASTPLDFRRNSDPMPTDRKSNCESISSGAASPATSNAVDLSLNQNEDSMTSNLSSTSGALDLTPKQQQAVAAHLQQLKQQQQCSGNGMLDISPTLTNTSNSPAAGSAMNGMLNRSASGRGGSNTTCQICMKTFACNSALEIHYRSHTKERPFKCSICARGFSTKGNMKQHMLTHKIRDFPPGLLGATVNAAGTPTIGSLLPVAAAAAAAANSPELGQLKEKLDLAGVLNASGLSENCLVNASLSSLASGFTFSRQDDDGTNGHSERRSTSNRSKSRNNSDAANSSGNNRSNSGNTRSSPGSEGSPVSASTNAVSGSGLPSGTPTTGSSSGSSDLRHMCDVCVKPFSSQSALQIHQRTHTGDRPFKCNICSRAFTTKGNLKVHMGTHMWTTSPSRRGRRLSIDMTFPNLLMENKNWGF